MITIPLLDLTEDQEQTLSTTSIDGVRLVLNQTGSAMLEVDTPQAARTLATALERAPTTKLRLLSSRLIVEVDSSFKSRRRWN